MHSRGGTGDKKLKGNHGHARALELFLSFCVCVYAHLTFALPWVLLIWRCTLRVRLCPSVPLLPASICIPVRPPSIVNWAAHHSPHSPLSLCLFLISKFLPTTDTARDALTWHNRHQHRKSPLSFRALTNSSVLAKETAKNVPEWRVALPSCKLIGLSQAARIQLLIYNLSAN